VTLSNRQIAFVRVHRGNAIPAAVLIREQALSCRPCRAPVVRPPGFEPGTCGLRVRCSAVELEALVTF
jgi:hypothetical protein